MQRSRLSILSLLSSLPAFCLLAASCIPAQQPDGSPPMCALDTDCDSAHGEICDEGVCWGNPPRSLSFAAVIVGPDDKQTLVPTEMPALQIDDQGTISDLVFSREVKISGRVVLACASDADPLECNPDTSISAQIKATRASRIPGGPEYSRTVIAAAGMGPGESAFELYLPLAESDDNEYELSIVPENSNPNQQSSTTEVATPAELAPPIRFALVPTQDMLDVEWVLGKPLDHKVVTGRVLDAAGRGIAGMQVWAMGRWTPASPLVRASSISTTDDDGRFEIRIPIAMHDLYDLIAKPEPDTFAPTLRMRDLYIEDPEGLSPDGNVVEIDDLHMPSHGVAMEFVLPVSGKDSGGGVVPVAGAEVRLTTILDDDVRGEASFTAEGTTDQDGNVTLKLIPSGLQQNRIYTARIIPPPSAEYATLDGVSIAVGGGDAAGPSFLAGPTLDRRVPVHGVVVNADGEPVAGATVSSRVSLELKWGLALDEQSELEYLQFPSDTADENGTFKLWLDPVLVGNAAIYDLEIVPPAGANAPRWTVPGIGVEADNDLNSVDLGTIALPPASFARGLVQGPGGEPVANAELRLYQLAEDNEICLGAILPASEDECVAPAQLRGIWKSDVDGLVRIVLPDPAADL